MATITISSGTAVSNTVVRGGDTLNVYGTGVHTLITSSGFLRAGIENIYSGGVASGTTVSMGTENVFSGGVASGTTLSLGSWVGSPIAPVQNVYSGGVAISTTVTDYYGEQNVYSGGIASRTLVSGTFNNIVGQVVYGGGKAYGTTLSGGDGISSFGQGQAVILSGGMGSGTTVDGGGSETVSAGGTESGVTISGGFVEIAKGGNSPQIAFSGGALSRGGTLRLDDSVDYIGSISGVTPGDVIDLGDIAFGPGTTVSFTEALGSTSGALQISDGADTANLVLAGSYTTSQFRIASDGAGGTKITLPATVTVSAGTTLSGAVIDDAETLLVYGTGVDTTVSADGVETIFSGGVASNTTLSGGTENVSAGGRAIGTFELGAVQYVYSGGIVSNTGLVNGTQYINSGGVASGTALGRGGRSGEEWSGGDNLQYVRSGGTAIDTVILDAGGTQTVLSDAIAYNTTIGGLGDVEYVSSGGTASGVTFSSQFGGTLELERPQDLTGVISDWHAHQPIDFIKTAIVGAAISGSNLRVTVSGGQNFTYQLASQPANTHVAFRDDFAGGTNVFLAVDYVVSSGQTSNGIGLDNSDTMTVLSGGTASGTGLIPGATLTVLAGGTVSNTSNGGGQEYDFGRDDSGTIEGTAVEYVSSGGTALGATISNSGSDRCGFRRHG